VSDPRVNRLAAVLVDYSLAVQPGQVVTIEATTLAAPLVRELCACVIRAGGHPLTRISIDGLVEDRLARASDEQLDWVSPRFRADAEHAAARIAILSDFNTRSRSGIDPSRQARVTRAVRPFRTRMFEREAAGEFRWVVSAYPTQALAQEARMSLADYTDFVFAGGLLDREDPVAAWREAGTRIHRLADRVHAVRELRIVGPGTDLTFSVEGRTWIASDGRNNFPDGECFTGPVEDSADGQISFSYPAVFNGRSVEGVRLRFRAGEVVEADAARGREFLEEMLAMDDGARRIGEFSFGLNDAIQEFTGEVLFDEKIGGTVHLALGEAYTETGGTNSSALHWDLVSDLRSGGEVYADGELVYRDGAFLWGAGGE
jgi:aminopeptidase